MRGIWPSLYPLLATSHILTFLGYYGKLAKPFRVADEPMATHSFIVFQRFDSLRS